jgi:hypothetical protein
MKKEETMTREEAEKMCKEMTTCIRQGVLNEIEVMHNKLFADAAEDKELFMIWTMAGDGLQFIIRHLSDTLEDIEKGYYLPKKAEVPA